MKLKPSVGFLSLWYQVTTWNRFLHDIQDRKDYFQLMLSRWSSNATTPQTHSLFFIYYLKKKKMFYHKSHWNVLLKKKIYLYFSHFSAFFPHFFLFLFRKRFVIFHQKQNKLFLSFFSIGHERWPPPCSDKRLPQSKKKQRKMHKKKYVIHSYHFGFIN